MLGKVKGQTLQNKAQNQPLNSFEFSSSPPNIDFLESGSWETTDLSFAVPEIRFSRYRSAHFDRSTGLFLAVSATGGARKRPQVIRPSVS